jgi:hypothetical protein
MGREESGESSPEPKSLEQGDQAQDHNPAEILALAGSTAAVDGASWPCLINDMVRRNLADSLDTTEASLIPLLGPVIIGHIGESSKHWGGSQSPK